MLGWAKVLKSGNYKPETLTQAIDVITGDPERLRQVVWKLVSSAIKFTPHEGHVTIRLEKVDPYLQLTVTDTRKGSSEELLPHNFNRFQQAASSSTPHFSGLRLGLALVRQLVELHDGSNRVWSCA
jgi:signal transduction histidine kinase